MKGFVDEVVILCGGQEIARHPRCYALGAFVADPLHYLALIETKPNASRLVRPWAEVKCRLSGAWLTIQVPKIEAKASKDDGQARRNRRAIAAWPDSQSKPRRAARGLGASQEEGFGRLWRKAL